MVAAWSDGIVGDSLPAMTSFSDSDKEMIKEKGIDPNCTVERISPNKFQIDLENEAEKNKEMPGTN